MKPRYKFYREHKYVSHRFNEFERLAAKADFRNTDELATIKTQFESLIDLLQAHAKYEDESLHVLLKNKNSPVYKTIEDDHHAMDQEVTKLRELLANIDHSKTDDEKIEAGYQFYLWYRKFSGENLIHLHEEETIILPELQRLYTDEELREVEFKTYRQMSSADMIGMLEELFPHMNPSDWAVFLTDLNAVSPEKFSDVWDAIKHLFSERQQADLEQRRSISKAY